MKVVLFCGGMGMRLRDYSDSIPKPLVPVGPEPILWSIMRYYAHHGHRDFVLCLGYRGDAIEDFFRSRPGARVDRSRSALGVTTLELHGPITEGWVVRLVETGLESCIGERLVRVRDQVAGEDLFLANYSDGLTDLPLDRYLAFVRKRARVAAFVSGRPTVTFHEVRSDADGVVTDVFPVAERCLINCGYFAFRPEIFDYLERGEDLVAAPFQRLIRSGELVTYRYDGFWQSMDSYRDRQRLEDMHDRGESTWAVWDGPLDAV